jgi:hypothetical protein
VPAQAAWNLASEQFSRPAENRQSVSGVSVICSCLKLLTLHNTSICFHLVGTRCHALFDRNSKARAVRGDDYSAAETLAVILPSKSEPRGFEAYIYRDTCLRPPEAHAKVCPQIS